MKNTKAILFIILGSFLLATGFAFAGTSQTFENAKNGVNFDGGTRSGDVTKVPSITAPTISEPMAANAEAAPEKPSLLKKAKDFVGNNYNQIMAGAVIGFLGFLVLGTGGAGLAVGLGAFAFFMLLNKL